MSHQAIADAFAPAEAAYHEKVMQHTWGHLAPERAKTYPGKMTFALGEYGDYVPIHADFEGLGDSPWFFQDMMDFIVEKATEPGIYKFAGKYRNHRFDGEVVRCLIDGVKQPLHVKEVITDGYSATNLYRPDECF